MKILTQTILLICGVLFVAMLLFAVVNYRTQENTLLQGLDERLTTAALFTRSILPPDYHDRIVGSESISDQTYETIVDTYNGLCLELGLEYIWTLARYEGQIVFTSGTSTSKDITQGDHARFYELHSNPAAYEAVFNGMQTSYQVIEDEWGRVRVVLVPFKDAKGRPYLVGAGVKLSDVQDQLRQSAIQSLLIGVGMLFFGFVVSSLVARRLTRPIGDLRQVAQRIAQGDWQQQARVQGSAELRSLATSLNTMSLNIQTTFDDLLESRNNLDITLDSIGDAVIVTDAQGQVTRLNPVAEVLTGWPEDQAINRPLHDVMNIDTSLPYRTDGSPVLVSRDGTRRQIDDKGAQIRDVDGRVVGAVLVFRDVTETFLAEAERKRLSAILESTSDLVSTSTIEGQLTYLNQAGLRLLGWPHDQDLNQVQIPNLHPDWAQDIISDEGLPAAVRDGIWWGETALLGPGGTEIPVSQVIMCHRSTSGEPEFFSTIMRDIREQRRTDTDLSRSKALLETVVNQTPVGILVGDAPEGQVSLINREAGRILGLGDATGMGKKLKALASRGWSAFHPDGAAWSELNMPLRLAVTKGHVAENEQMHIRRKNDDDVVVLCNAAPIRDEQGEVIAGIVTLMDITQRQTDKQERASLEHQLRESQKMEAIGQLAGGVAHDFNNMLTAILGNLDLIRLAKSDPTPSDGYENELEQIERVAKRAASLTRQLLAFSRRQVARPVELDLNSTLEEMKSMLGRLIGEQIRLETDLDGGLHHVVADPGQVEQVVMNLAVNARDSISGDGRILIRTENASPDLDLPSDLSTETSTAWIRLIISDTGCGMDQAVQDRIFEPFFTTKPQGQGTGLGLSTVYGIVKQANGMIDLESRLDQGTTFTIWLPAAAPHQTATQTVDRSAASTEKPASMAATGTILVCEDDQTVAEMIAMILTRGGYQVLMAHSGAEALRLAENALPDIQLLLTDVVMPEMDGLQLAKAMQEMKPGLKTLFISGYTADIIAKHGILEKDVELLDKPFTRSVLLNRIAKLLSA